MKLFFRYIGIFLFLCQSLHAQTEKRKSLAQWLEKTFSETDTTYISPNNHGGTKFLARTVQSERRYRRR